MRPRLSALQPVRFRFDAFVLDAARGQLLCHGQEIPLRRQSFDVLVYLATHAGAIVDSKELVAAIWSAQPADLTGSVAQCIKEIRQALGQDARWIVKTVSGRGYRLMAEVVPAEAGPPADALEIVPLATAGRSVSEAPIVDPPAGLEAERSGAHPLVDVPDIAIVPQISDNSGVATARFARKAALVWHYPYGLALALLILISGVVLGARPDATATRSTVMTMMAAPTIAVLSFTATGRADGGVAAAFREEVRAELFRSARGYDLVIKVAASDPGKPPADAALLGVRYVLSGTVRLEKQALLATLQIVEAESGRLVWSAPFEIGDGNGAISNLSAARIAQEIVLQVRTVESNRQLPDKPETGHYVLQARAMSQTSFAAGPTLKARALYSKALELDPNSLRAMEGSIMMDLRVANSGYIAREEMPAVLAGAQASIDRLITFDARNPVPHTLRGDLYRWRRDWDKAVAAFEYALSLNPNHAYAHAALVRSKIEIGRSQEALKHAENAIALRPSDPFNHLTFMYAGMAAVHLEDDRGALQWLLKARQADITYSFGALWLAIAYSGIGEKEKARASYAEFARERPNFSVTWWRKQMATGNPVVVAQRERIAELLRRIGVPERSPAPTPKSANEL